MTTGRHFAKLRRFRLDWRKIEYVCLVTLWAGLSLTLSQFVVLQPMILILGERITLPFWMLVYYLLSYALMLVLIIVAPPYLYRIIQSVCARAQKRHAVRKSNSRKLRKNSPSEKTANLEESSKPLSLQTYTIATNPEELGVSQPITFVDIGLAPIGYVVYGVIAGLIVNLMSVFPWFNPDQTQDVGFSGYIAGFDRIYAMLAIVFLAPIAEEILMRGWLYGKLRDHLKILPAILITSLLFAFLHGQWNVSVRVFVLSFILCFLRETTGSIWAGILLHILTNGIAFYSIYIGGF